MTAQRPKVDDAQNLPWLVDGCAPEAAVMRVVLDKLPTQKFASLSAAFASAEARRTARKLALPDTPMPGRWWHMAARAWRVLQPPCRDGRLPDADMLQRAMAVWEPQCHASQATIEWRVAVTEACKKWTRLASALPV